MRPIGLEEWRRLFVRTVSYFGDSGATAQYVYLQPGIVLCPTTHHVRPVELADLARRIAEHFGAPPQLYVLITSRCNDPNVYTGIQLFSDEYILARLHAVPGGVELEQYLGRAEYNAFRKMSLTGIFQSAFPCAPSTRLHMVGFTFQGAGAARTIVIERHGSRARSSVGSKKRTMIPPPVGTYEWRHCVLREAIREERTVRVLFQTTGVPGLHMFRTWHERVARIDDIERLRRIPRDTVLPEGLTVDFVPMKKFPVRLFLETIYPYCERMGIVGAAESDVPMCS